MINVKHRHCEECSSIASYAFEGQRPRRCRAHAEEGMVGVIYELCDHCRERAYFATPGNRPCRCSDHKKEGDVRCPRRRRVVQKPPARADHRKWRGDVTLWARLQTFGLEDAIHDALARLRRSCRTSTFESASWEANRGRAKSLPIKIPAKRLRP